MHQSPKYEHPEPAAADQVSQPGGTLESTNEVEDAAVEVSIKARGNGAGSISGKRRMSKYEMINQQILQAPTRPGIISGGQDLTEAPSGDQTETEQISTHLGYKVLAQRHMNWKGVSKPASKTKKAR